MPRIRPDDSEEGAPLQDGAGRCVEGERVERVAAPDQEREAPAGELRTHDLDGVVVAAARAHALPELERPAHLAALADRREQGATFAERRAAVQREQVRLAPAVAGAGRTDPLHDTA